MASVELLDDPFRSPSNIERFWARITHDESGCWLWDAADPSNGYGKFNLHGSVRYAHRVSYELLVEPIPAGLVLDHLCRVRHCVNPAHLEPVTHRVNILRGTAPSAIKAHATTCDEGHPLPPREPGRKRVCRECRNAYRRKRYSQGLSR